MNATSEIKPIEKKGFTILHGPKGGWTAADIAALKRATSEWFVTTHPSMPHVVVLNWQWGHGALQTMLGHDGFAITNWSELDTPLRPRESAEKEAIPKAA